MCRFTEFKVPRLYLGNQAVLSLFATGRTTGTVLDSGEGITHSVPIYEGYAIPHAITEIPICGRDLTRFLHYLLAKQPNGHIKWHPGSNRTEAQAKDHDDCEKECITIKEEHGVVALDYDAELKTATDSSHTDTRKYKLPTGHHISVKEESLKCPELLFLPTHWEEMKIEDGIA